MNAYEVVSGSMVERLLAMGTRHSSQETRSMQGQTYPARGEQNDPAEDGSLVAVSHGTGIASSWNDKNTG